MRTLAPIVAAAVAAGCATARPATEVRTAEVRQLQADRVGRCKYLGAVQGAHANGASVAENEDAAVEQVRGQAARMGATAFVVTERSTSMWRSVVHADVFLCPSWEPVPGLPPR